MATPPAEPGLHHLPHAPVDWISLFGGLTATALTAAAIAVAAMAGFDHASAPTIFLFAFGYAFLAALAVGIPALGRLIRRRALNWKTAAMAGAFAAALPGATYVLFVANCRANAVIAGIALCAEGERTLAAWGWGAALVAGLAIIGALEGLVGYGVYRSLKRLISPHH